MLAHHFKNALRKSDLQKNKNQIELEKIYRRALLRQNDAIERKIG